MITRRNIKLRRALLVAACLALAGLVATELLSSIGKPSPVRPHWVEIGVATDGTKAYVNQRSIIETGMRITLWQRFTLGRRKGPTGAADTVEQLVIYDCPSRIVSTLESREIGRSGIVVRTQKFRPAVKDEIRPGTLPEYMYDAVC